MSSAAQSERVCILAFHASGPGSIPGGANMAGFDSSGSNMAG